MQRFGLLVLASIVLSASLWGQAGQGSQGQGPSSTTAPAPGGKKDAGAKGHHKHHHHHRKQTGSKQ